MKLICLIALCIITPLISLSQKNIIGIVINKNDGKPIPNVSVYINNSGIGTETDGTGNFTLSSATEASELIFSHVGYEKKTVLFKSTSSSGKLEVTLTPKVETIDNVIIKSKNKETWNKWGSFFKEYFLGKTQFAKSCKIINPEAIWFRYNKNTKTLVVKAREPILIRNDALGYLVSFDLDSFSYSFQSNIIFRSGSTFFKPLEAKDNNQKQIWAENRILAYRGSQMHFFRALYTNQLEKEGFIVYQFTSKRNFEKQRIQSMLLAHEAKMYEESRNSKFKTASLTNNKDSLLYYQEVMKSSDYDSYDSLKLKIDERVTKEPDSKTQTLHFDSDTLLIVFDDELEKVFLKRSSNKIKRYKTLSQELRESYNFFKSDNMLKKQTTLMYLLEDLPLSIEINGYSYNALLFNDGYMAAKKLGHLLPWDYEPEKDLELIK